MKIVVELEFPWDDSGTIEDQETFAKHVAMCVADASVPDGLRPMGTQIASVRTVRGSMAVARDIVLSAGARARAGRRPEQ
jgi:hypothetical protein